jgi:DNA-binding transcriptional regulator GbsR (MarR family)
MNAALPVATENFIHPVEENFNEPLESGIQSLFPCSGDFGLDAGTLRVQDQFIDTWARMAGAFAMDRNMGRVHALLYVSTQPLDASTIALRLASTEEACALHLERLTSWGMIHAAGRTDDGRIVYEAEQDPWSWFLRTIRERHTREFSPLQQSVRDVLQAARQLSQVRGDADARGTYARIERFARFIDEFFRLIDAFVTLGAKPMATVLKMVAKFMPRSAH